MADNALMVNQGQLESLTHRSFFNILQQSLLPTRDRESLSIGLGAREKMPEIALSDRDVKQIQGKGMTTEKVISQIETFKAGFPHAKLVRPCTIGDGIGVLQKADLVRLSQVFSKAVLAGRVMKFVPASGAATRMFKSLLSLYNQHDQMDEKAIRTGAGKNDPDHVAFFQFIQGINKFAFYDDLKWVMARDGLDVEALRAKGEYKPILEYVLSSKGLDLTHIPKGLIKFHTYPETSRTPFEEHLVEASGYTTDRNRVARLHFTVSPEHEPPIKEHLGKVRDNYEKSGVRFQIGVSVQRPSTDTIAVELDNRPFRGEDRRLVFRPGGHGALLENLNALKADLVFIKNIDNVVPDRLKEETFIYKKALGGYLIELQKEIFETIERLPTRGQEDRFIKETFAFIRDILHIVPPEGMDQISKEDQIDYLVSRLNRPLRICGMVKNEGEPGGGPFWVEQEDKSTSVQIVESSQVDMRLGVFLAL
jgi:hypothetical protein